MWAELRQRWWVELRRVGCGRGCIGVSVGRSCVGSGRSWVGSGSTGDSRCVFSVCGVGLGNGGSGASSDGIRCPGSGVPSSGGCDVICGCSDSGLMANGSGHIVGKILVGLGFWEVEEARFGWQAP
eukprot:g15202.t1